MKTKKIKYFTDKSFGFPVRLSNVTLVKIRNEWAPKLDYPRIALKVLQVLSHLYRPLTGHEVRFIRQHFAMTQTAFASKFSVTHVAVHKWERRGSQATSMQWSTEKDLRLFIQSKLKNDPKAIGKLYEELTERSLVSHKALSRTTELVTA